MPKAATAVDTARALSYLGHMARARAEQPKNEQITLRVTEAELARAEGLAERMAATGKPELTAFGLSRTSVLRLAMLRGLATLEAEYPPPKAEPKRRRKAS